MGHLSIHCGGCGSDWIVYHRDDFKDWKARTCPVCGKTIDSQTWEKNVLRAFGEMEDANMELVKDHAQTHGTLFTVSYIPDVSFQNSGVAEELGHLREEVESLRRVVMRLVSCIFEGGLINDF